MRFFQPTQTSLFQPISARSTEFYCNWVDTRWGAKSEIRRNIFTVGCLHWLEKI